MDTARADIVNEPKVMPTLHDLAGDGCRFTRCFANAPWTLPSHSSIFTGQLPSDHGVIGKGDIFDADNDLATLLNQEGYRTAAFSNNPWISPDFGFDSFDDFIPGWKRFKRGSDLAGVSQLEGTITQLKSIATKLADHNAPFTLANAFYMRFLRGKTDSGAKLTTRRLTNWIEEHNHQKPFFAFANYMEPHLEYSPPDEYANKYLPEGVSPSEAKQSNQDPWAYLVGEASMNDKDFDILRALYRAELSYLDDQIAHLIEYLDETDLLNETAIFLLGDHGENIGDHGLMDHQYSLTDSLLHVPLIARYPPTFDSGTESDGLVELRDLFPTVIEMAGATVPSDNTIATNPLQETSSTDREYVLSEYLTPQPAIDTLRERYNKITTDLSKYDRSLRSIRTADWRFVLASDGRNELYKINESQAKQVPVDSSSEIVSELKDILVDAVGTFPDVHKQSDKGSQDLPSANQEHLEDLGYL